MHLDLVGKRALVMAASSGLGRAIASELVAEGATVSISARDQERLETAASQIGAAHSFAADYAASGAVADMARSALTAMGGIDVLVTNCGGPARGNFDALTTDDWRGAFQSVWLSAVEAIQICLPEMKKQRWGRILLVTSSSVREPLPGLTLSNCMRPGLAGLANSLSKEVAPLGITVNLLVPGTMDTQRIADLGLPVERVVERIPSGRLGRPEELGALAAFLASSRASYITGQALACDGGRLAGI